jgi:hypothetical protein
MPDIGAMWYNWCVFESVPRVRPATSASKKASVSCSVTGRTAWERASCHTALLEVYSAQPEMK